MYNNDSSDEKENTQIWTRDALFSDRNTRLDKFWGTELENDGISRGKAKDWIKAGLAEVDGVLCKKPNYKLAGGEKLTLKGEVENNSLIPEDKPLDIIFNDGRVAVINKPAGLTTHPAPSCPTETLVHRLIHHFPEIQNMDEWRPGIVHRLDKFTSGLIAVALNDHDRLALSAAFAEREVDKTYLAIVHGVPDKDFADINMPIGRHPIHKTKMAVVLKGGRDARSSYEVLWTDPAERASLLRVKIYTGRTHQIRVHMAHIGHPLLGDQVYGSQQHTILKNQSKPLSELASRQMLHAYSLSFNHPETDERLSFTLTPPDDFITLLKELNSSVQRVGLIGMPCCGKSTALKLLSEKGIPVFSADKSVSDTYNKDGAGWEMIRQRFGNKFTETETGNIDKKKVFTAICEDGDIRREIMNIVHPIVQHETALFFQTNATTPLAVAEIPLLLEAGWHTQKLVDVVIGIRCPDSKRTQELREKRGLDPETLATFDSWQWDEKAKMDCCTAIIDNDSGVDELKANTEKVLLLLAEMREAKAKKFDAFLKALFKQEDKH
ncbi:23S rRNA pseudouridine1911/1915/1917 synthase [Maridesulfovibrio ferrireducens]|uniref:Dephospho-CoA kinase n=1 Tax=Maridesulfovibrio ferrireducens TaxID=246191 RepID=A0A1G9EBY1_9BACT|nr:dephospho-CoA kinase [Maridesulfovibrio ferrireducens]SDK73535.1 23S rRNA pseudouridine1911/1915/1917 synthase [Maridesulfovibrio ferrireducens]